MVSPLAIGKACAKPTALPLPPVDAVQVLTFGTLRSPCALPRMRLTGGNSRITMFLAEHRLEYPDG